MKQHMHLINIKNADSYIHNTLFQVYCLCINPLVPEFFFFFVLFRDIA